jgi:hypothetical protein
VLPWPVVQASGLDHHGLLIVTCGSPALWKTSRTRHLAGQPTSLSSGSLTCMIFVFWLHGAENMYYFLNHLNSIHSNIQFTMESEMAIFPSCTLVHTGNQMAPWGTTYTGSWPTTCIWMYLNKKLHHHLVNKYSVLPTLVHRSRAICDQDSLPEELEFL